MLGLVSGLGVLAASIRTPILSANENEEIFGAFLKISEEGRVTVAVPQSEMGQGVYTILPQILADELGADWRTVAVEPTPLNPLYANGLLAEQWAETLLPPGTEKLSEQDRAKAVSDWMADRVAERNDFIVTADSTSIPAYGDRFREAGAAARILLSKAAARRWDIGWESCTAKNGVVSNGDKKLKFGDLVRDAVQ